MNSDIHRLLDEAFAGIEMTPDAQDLKEEVRANLVARTAELEASGKASADAAQPGDRRARRRARAARRDAPPPRRVAGTRERPGRLPAPPRAPEGRLRRAGRRLVGRLVVVGLTLAVLGATGVLPLPVGPIIAAPRRRLDGRRPARRRLARAGDDDQPPDAQRTRRRLRAGDASSRAYGLGFGGLVALGALADVVRRLRRARGDRLDHPVRVPRRDADQPHKAWVRTRSATARRRATASRTSPRPPHASASTPPSSGS